MENENVNVPNEKQTAPQTITNLDQAISILIQGCEVGRQKGIFNWDDLNLLGQAIALFTNIQKQNEEAQKVASETPSVEEVTNN